MNRLGNAVVAAVLAVGASVIVPCAPAAAAEARIADPKPADAARTSKARQQASRQLMAPDARTRLAALTWYGNHGREEETALIAPRLRDEDPAVRELAQQTLIRMWGRSGDPAIDRMFRTGLIAMENGQLGAALGIFNELIRRRPSFTEAWNKRATIYFLMDDYERSLADCDEVVKRVPAHFGALAGYGQIYYKLGDEERALDYFKQAFDVNPNLDAVQAGIRALERSLEQRQRSRI